MKKPILFALYFLAALGLRAATIDLDVFGKLNFTLDPSWKIASAPSDGAIEVMITSRNGVNAFCGFTIVINPSRPPATPAGLRSNLIADSREDAAGSVEQRTDPKEFAGKTGFGFSADFTDKALVGKPPAKGDAKVQTKVMLVLNDNVSVSGAVYSDGFREPDHLQLLEVFKSMEVLPPPPEKK